MISSLQKRWQIELSQAIDQSQLLSWLYRPLTGVQLLLVSAPLSLFKAFKNGSLQQEQ